MKALSIRQPWIWAILDIPESDCPKRVENRKATAFHYRGPVLLHASSGGTRREFGEATVSIMFARADHGYTNPVNPHPISPRFPAGFDRSQMQRGCFLGIALIVGVDVHPASFGGRPTSGYRIAGHLGLNLADVRRLPPVPAKGQLGLYNVEHNDSATRDESRWVNFGEHREVYETAWAELAAKGGAA